MSAGQTSNDTNITESDKNSLLEMLLSTTYVDGSNAQPKDHKAEESSVSPSSNPPHTNGTAKQQPRAHFHSQQQQQNRESDDDDDDASSLPKSTLVQTAPHANININNNINDILTKESEIVDLHLFNDGSQEESEESLRLRHSAPTFHAKVFLFEFLTHLFYPLSIPAILFAQGTQAAVNKGMIPGTGVFNFQFVFTVVMLLPPIFLACTYADEKWALAPVFVGTICASFRILVIGGKYGSFPEEHYQEVITGTYNPVTELLIATWGVRIASEALDLLVEQAELATSIDLSEMYFTLAGGAKISTKLYAVTLSRTVFGRPTGSVIYHGLTKGGSLILVAIAIFSFVTKADDTRRGSSIALLIATIFQLGLYGSVVFSFLAIGILHYLRIYSVRKAHVASLLLSRDVSKFAAAHRRKRKEEESSNLSSNMVQMMSKYSGEDNDTSYIPPSCRNMIPAWDPANLIAWVTVSTVLGEFAGIHTRRMSFNFFANLVVCALLGSFLLLSVWSGGAMDNVLIAYICFIFAIMALGMLPSAFLAYRANFSELQVLKYFEEERFALHWRAQFSDNGSGAQTYRVAHKQSKADDDLKMPKGNMIATPRGSMTSKEAIRSTAREQLGLSNEDQMLIETIDAATSLIERRNEVSPLKVMFVAASPELVSFMVSLLVSGVMLIAGVLMQAAPSTGN